MERFMYIYYVGGVVCSIIVLPVCMAEETAPVRGGGENWCFRLPEGGAKHMCFMERHVSDLLPQGENLDGWWGDRGGSCRFQSPLLFLFQAFGWHGRTGPLPKDYTQVGELARF